MNPSVRREWPSVLTAVIAVTYGWIGTVSAGWYAVWGVGGGVLLLAGLLVARRFPVPGLVLLVAGVLPLAVATWWSLVTPLLALAALSLAGVATYTATRSSTTTSGRVR